MKRKTTKTLVFPLMALLGITFTPPSWSETDEASYSQAIPDLLKKVNSPNQPQTCETSPKQSKLEKCHNKMDKLYADHKANIDVFIGYNDLDIDDKSAFTADSIMRAYFVDRLTRTCSTSKLDLCGFQFDQNDADKLTKKLPNGDEVQVTISDSAVTNRDAVNKQSPSQKKKTDRTLQKFKTALQTSEAVFYVGHSRDGGGPDFAPARRAASGHVDYNWYKAHRPGLHHLLEHMSDGHPDIYGSFSCDSMKHFAKPLRKTNPSLLYFGTTRLANESYNRTVPKGPWVPTEVTSSEVIDSMDIAITNIIKRECEFNRRFKERNMPTVADYGV
jgi:hypothetical protein